MTRWRGHAGCENHVILPTLVRCFEGLDFVRFYLEVLLLGEVSSDVETYNIEKVN